MVAAYALSLATGKTHAPRPLPLSGVTAASASSVTVRA
jgi:hypothetical protein